MYRKHGPFAFVAAGVAVVEAVKLNGSVPLAGAGGIGVAGVADGAAEGVAKKSSVPAAGAGADGVVKSKSEGVVVPPAGAGVGAGVDAGAPKTKPLAPAGAGVGAKKSISPIISSGRGIAGTLSQQNCYVQICRNQIVL